MANSHVKSLRPYVVWFLGAFFFFVDYILRVAPSILTPTLMQYFHTNAFTIGGLSAFFYYAYISMQIPVGILVDRFGPKPLLIMSSLICAASTFMFAEVNSIPLLFLSRFLMGFGASFAFVGTLKLISIWFKAEQFAFLAGLTQSLGMIGAMVGQGPMALIYKSVDWHLSMQALALLFLILAFLMFYFIQPKNPIQLENKNPENGSIRQAFKWILTNPQNGLNCLFIGLLYAPSACFGEQWGASFLSVSQGISIEAAGQQTGMMFIGLALGCPVLGFISDKIQRRLLVMRVSVSVCFLLLSLVIYGPLIPFLKITPLMYTFILFLYGFFNSGIVCSYALASETNPRQFTGMALGIVNMASVLVGATLIPIVGFILDRLWHGTLLEQARVFSTQEYQLAFIALPLGFILAFIISFFLKESYCQRMV